MSTLVKITLDSGTLLEDDQLGAVLDYVDVGMFRPTMRIYGDGRIVGVFEEDKLSGDIEVRLTGSEGREKTPGVGFESALLSIYLLRLTEIYGQLDFVPVDLDAYHSILRFTSGLFRSSKIKERDFKEFDTKTHLPTGKVRRLRPIAHDLVVELEMRDGEALELSKSGKVLWSSSEYSIRNSLDIEILTDNSTAEMYYFSALRLREGATYWLPNQGDPPPSSPYKGRGERKPVEPTEILDLQQDSRWEVSRFVEGLTRERKIEVLNSLIVGLGGVPSAEPEETVAEQETRAVDRYLNLWFTTNRADEPRIRESFSLAKDKLVYLRVNIAPFDSRSILQEAQPFISQDEIERAFPQTRGKPVTLDVNLFSSDFRIPSKERTKKLKLSRGKPTDTLFFPVTPLNIGVAHLRVCVFYKNHLLQSMGVVSFVDGVEGYTQDSPRAYVETTYSADFANAGQLPARGLWLGINESVAGTHTLNIKGSNEALSRDLEHTIENALKQARQALNEVSFEIERDEDGNIVNDDKTGLPKKKYRFDKNNFPRAADESGYIKRFKGDLIELARVGRVLFDAVFGTGAVPTAEEKDVVLPLADKLKKLLRDEQVIQISRLKDLGDIWPWALMYDLSINFDKVKDVCLAFRDEDGRALPYKEGIKGCKHRNPKTGNHIDSTVVCPYGFWGFRHIIEQPVWPGGKQAFADLKLKITIPVNPVLEMPLAEDLKKIEPDHIANMTAFKFKSLASLQEIMEALHPDFQRPEPHILYFFCHGKYDAHNNAYLEVGVNEALLPSELDDWTFRWENSHGLVFINGCHTADLLPKDLSIIMAPFVKAYASGIIGTEVTVHTFLAREFAQGFFKRLLPNGNPGQKVGAIIRELRLELLMKYNPLGLVYTPYCSADLQFTR
jgi:hypothetical protein